MKCQICSKKCNGKITIRDPNLKDGLIVCPSCLGDYAGQNYDKLMKKISGKYGRKES